MTSIDIAPDDTDDRGLYPDDRSELDLPTRRALVQLLKGPLITSARHPEIWRTVVREERLLRSRLADLFLVLVIDDENELALTRPADTGELNTPAVLRTERLTFMDTVMLLALRQRLLQAQPGERVIVDRDEIAEQLEVYRGSDNTDPSGYARRVNASWSKLDKYSILSKTSTEDRREISPVLRQLFDADQITLVSKEFRRILEGDGA
ncbi:DUF4194 domain-containing protein [Rhodococcus triatomae]|uniref:DUF4194 domain-containing protein n=1 Tax=Rhodococcus triatomae TaxID=300028 RepID=A0A1G8KQ20_9NOCA|nr:DUF4194 domain-containing protein [Rhodococcus triatomae]QNG18991.1 DUF4194 domain-containing protein [Rhodococcus triatomae]QNG25096.1 DUF4194 domain-containing protein [Rhodococcus triatomae]SDI45493.1 protein of unknown function [Rhodococcus triatomae]